MSLAQEVATLPRFESADEKATTVRVECDGRAAEVLSLPPGPDIKASECRDQEVTEETVRADFKGVPDNFLDFLPPAALVLPRADMLETQEVGLKLAFALACSGRVALGLHHDELGGLSGQSNPARAQRLR